MCDFSPVKPSKPVASQSGKWYSETLSLSRATKIEVESSGPGHHRSGEKGLVSDRSRRIPDDQESQDGLV